VDPTNRNTALASAMVEELARCGMRHAVVSPGSRSTPLALALWRERSIDVSVIVDERSAGFFALGGAQSTGRPVAVLCTSGTAAANLHPAVCEADQSAGPLVVLTADRPPELRDIGAGQTIDQLKLYGDAVRWFCEVGTHKADDSGLLHFRSIACRAFALAAGDPRPGPVHLNLAWRDPLGPEPRRGAVVATSKLALAGRGDRPLTSVPSSPPAPWPELLDAIVERVEASPRGVIVAGRQGDPRLAEPLATLARATGFPLLAEPTSQLRWGGHDKGLLVGRYDALARVHPPALEPELVLRFGELPTSKALRQWLGGLGCPQLVVDPSYGWHEPTRRAGAVIRADAAGLASALSERLAGARTDPTWSELWLAADRAVADAVGAELKALPEPTEPGLWPALGAALQDGELVYTGSSMPIRDQEAFLPAGEGDVLFLANRGANGIDGLVSSGIGAAHTSGRPTTIVTGDLGLLHDLGGLAALRDVKVPVRIIVVDNGGGGIFEFLPQADQLERAEFEALLGTARGLDLERVAGLFDLACHGLRDLGALPAALEAGTGLIHVSVDRAQNVSLHRRLNEAAVAATREAVS